MLEKDYQLSAYKKLAAAGGMKTPGAITSARNSANTAKLLAEELTGLILDTIVYPDTITSYVSTIRTTTTGLTNIVELATKHADLLAGYADLNRPGFPGECFICELRLPDHRFRWKH
ncbi:hypothetical protein MZG62_24445, partial [Escherichia coli]|nr:hypothetical protein [Escherichia coli]